MLMKIVIVLCMQHGYVYPYTHKKPIAQTLWPAPCVGNERVLNDCNWCVCEKNTVRFTCSARACHEVDMFGHFNDAIREHVVGMEGHGSWRSNGTVCKPRAHYQRRDTLCVCDDDGNWPNPVCRDLFQVLHEVELTGHARPSALHECVPHKLYLYGCDVCLCPPEGRVDPAACTRNNCSRDDPVLLPAHQLKKTEQKFDLSEVYAECELNRKYVVGCKKCICLKNNRLLCDNCERQVYRTGEEDDYCAKVELKEPFNIECNTCVCDDRGVMYCTTRRCLNENQKPSLELSKSVDLTLRSVEPPMDSLECIPNTKYRQDCNTCFCTETYDGQKSLSCTLMACHYRHSDPHAVIKNDCIENTVYEVNCLVCRCDVVDGVKRETCLVSSVCSQKTIAQEVRSDDIDALHGYCEPAHQYRKDCNTCRCLADGKVAACSARVCGWGRGSGQGRGRARGAVTAEVVPVRQRGGARCPPDHMYQVDCNYCFCLKNGNLLCTTAKCDGVEKK